MNCRMSAALGLLVSMLASGVDPSGAQAGEQVEVALAFRALAEGGDAIRDLSAADVSITLDGERRPVTSLTFVSPAPKQARSDVARLPPPFVTNALPAPRRDVLLYVDEESITAAGHVHLRAAVTRLLGQLDPIDRVGLTSSQIAGITIPPTTDRDRIAAAIARFQGQRFDSTHCTFEDFLGRFRSLLGSAPNDRPTTIVFVTGGIGGCDPRSSPRRRDDMSRLGQVARSAAADMYVVYVMSQADPGPNTLHNLASVTGGTFLRLASGDSPVVDAIVRETAAFYVATFPVDSPEIDDSLRRLEVDTAREDVQIRAQGWLRMRQAALAAPGVTAVGAILRSPAERRGLALRAKTLVSPNAADDRLRLLTMFQTTDPSAEISAAMVGVYDDHGDALAQWSARGVELRDSMTLAAVLVRPGVYRVRVAAASVDGRMGTVDERVRAEPARAGPAAISEIVIGAERSGGLTPLLEVEEHAFLALCEVYDVPPGVTVTATMDLARSADGEPLAVAETTVAESSDPGRWVVHGRFSLEAIDLDPGDYLVRATVALAGGEVGRVARTLRRR